MHCSVRAVFQRPDRDFQILDVSFSGFRSPSRQGQGHRGRTSFSCSAAPRRRTCSWRLALTLAQAPILTLSLTLTTTLDRGPLTLTLRPTR